MNTALQLSYEIDAWTDARNFCMKAHAGQVRKYTREPYHEHCFAVAGLVSARTPDIDLAIAALLHDTLEDTKTTLVEIAKKFGDRVAGLVLELTDEFTHEAYPELNRRQRKLMECARMATVSPEAKLIKLCDLADNTRSIVALDPDFAVVYLREKAQLLEAMGFTGEES